VKRKEEAIQNERRAEQLQQNLKQELDILQHDLCHSNRQIEQLSQERDVLLF
jgi:hypothetical protein